VAIAAQIVTTKIIFGEASAAPAQPDVIDRTARSVRIGGQDWHPAYYMIRDV
jgi:hypothetical protein